MTDTIGDTDSLDPQARAWAWQRVHGVTPNEAVTLAAELPTTDPRRVHYAGLMLAEWRTKDEKDIGPSANAGTGNDWPRQCPQCTEMMVSPDHADSHHARAHPG